jgi:quercetin dioxygenase-like cupin family protein
MQVYDTGLNKGKRIQDFGSTGVTISTLISSRAWHVALLQLEPNGLLGAHKVATDQLMILVQGSARVSGDTGDPVDIVPGSAPFWNRGERHEIRAGSKGGLAVIVEGDKLAQALMMTIRKVTG